MERGLDSKSPVMKNVARGFSALSIPIMASLPYVHISTYSLRAIKPQ